MLSRRHILIGLPLAAAGCATIAVAPGVAAAEPRLTALCASLGAGNRLGVAVIDTGAVTGSGREIGYSADQRFAMASTFKAPLAVAILAEVGAGRMALADPLPFGEADLTSYAPVARALLGRGAMSVEEAVAAILEVSDNVAANLLLRRIGGPAGFTAFLRRHGDSVSRLDRYEEELNTNLPGDPRDTTTPRAMARLLRRLLVGDVLSPASRARLHAWMESSTTGHRRLRAGLPSGWRIGDKTGTGARGAANVVAIVQPPARPPIIIASYLDAPTLTPEQRDAAHAELARIVGAEFSR